jgi:hypothetical protein
VFIYGYNIISVLLITKMKPVRFDDLVAMAREQHPIPFRTRK